jgi:hypothetical protein
VGLTCPSAAAKRLALKVLYVFCVCRWMFEAFDQGARGGIGLVRKILSGIVAHGPMRVPLGLSLNADQSSAHVTW